MSHTGKKISRPVDQYGDLGTVFGTGSGNLGYNVEVGNINKWAKYKPVRMAGHDFFATQGDPDTGRWRPDATWWRGTGMTTEGGVTYYTLASMRIPVAQGAIGGISSGFIRNLADGLMGWTYFRPTGNINVSPFRDFDAIQYNGNAISPLPTTPAATMEGYNPTTGASTMVGVLPVITEVDNLLLTDLIIPSELITTQPNLSQFYLGMLFYNPAKTVAYWCTARNPLNDPTDNKHVNVPFVFPTDMRGKFYARSFLSRYQLTQNENPYNGFYVGGAEEERTMIIAPSNVIGTANFDIITAKWLSTTQLNARIEVYNYTASSVSASVVMQLVNPISGDVDESRSYAAQSVGAGESVNVGGAWNVGIYDPGYILRVITTINGSPITKTSSIDPI